MFTLVAWSNLGGGEGFDHWVRLLVYVSEFATFSWDSKGAAGHDNELRKFCRGLCFGQSPVKFTLCAKSPAKK